MLRRTLLAIAMTASVAMPSFAAGQSVAQMRWQRRVLLVSAPEAGDPRLALQRRIVDEWKAQAADRDLSLVAIAGGSVRGASDGAATLRRRYGLPDKGFAAILIGKDGGVKLRSAAPIAADTLQGTIDAMPMRRAGQR